MSSDVPTEPPTADEFKLTGRRRRHEPSRSSRRAEKRKLRKQSIFIAVLFATVFVVAFVLIGKSCRSDTGTVSAPATEF